MYGSGNPDETTIPYDEIIYKVVTGYDVWIVHYFVFSVTENFMDVTLNDSLKRSTAKVLLICRWLSFEKLTGFFPLDNTQV